MDFCRAAPFGLDTGAGKPLSLLLIAGRSRFWFGYMNFPFCSDYYGRKAPLPLFGRNIKSARYRYGFLQGSPFQVGYHSPPFWAGVGAGKYRSPPAAAGSSASRPPLFAGCRTFSACIKAAAGRAPVYCKAQVAAEGGRRRRFALRAKPTAKPSSPPPAGGRAACGAPRRVCTRPGSQPLPQQPQKLRPSHPAQGTVPDPVRQHHRQLLALPLFIRP